MPDVNKASLAGGATVVTGNVRRQKWSVRRQVGRNVTGRRRGYASGSRQSVLLKNASRPSWKCQQATCVAIGESQDNRCCQLPDTDTTGRGRRSTDTSHVTRHEWSFAERVDGRCLSTYLMVAVDSRASVRRH